MSPPLHPWFPLWEQSTSDCSENSYRVPVLMALTPSMAPTVEKAQHDPHCPWFLTAETAPLAFQSMESAWLSCPRMNLWFFYSPYTLVPVYRALNSSVVKSENSLWPKVMLFPKRLL